MKKAASQRNPVIALGVIVLLAIGLRLGVLAIYPAWLNEDRDAYLGIAKSIAEGRGYSVPESNQPTAYRPPLYPLFLAGLLWLGATPITLGLGNVLLGAIAVGLTGWAGLRWWGIGPAIIAAVIVAIEPLGLANTPLLMTETMATCLLAAWLVAAGATARGAMCSPNTVVGCEDTGRRSDGALLAGFIAGLGTLCRPILLPTTLAGWVWLMYASRPNRQTLVTTLRRQMTGSMVFIGGCGIVLLPWVVRNTLVMGAPIMTTSHGGYTLMLGHNAAYSAEVVHGPSGAVWSHASLTAWQKEVDAQLLNQGIQPHEELRRDRAMSKMAWATISSDPVEAVRSAGTLLSRLWSLAPLSTAERPVPRSVRSLIALFNGALFLLAAAGLLGLFRSDLRLAGLLSTPVLVFTVMHSLYWADQRMRAPLVPALALLAAWSLSTVYGRLWRNVTRNADVSDGAG